MALSPDRAAGWQGKLRARRRPGKHPRARSQRVPQLQLRKCKSKKAMRSQRAAAAILVRNASKDGRTLPTGLLASLKSARDLSATIPSQSGDRSTFSPIATQTRAIIESREQGDRAFADVGRFSSLSELNRLLESQHVEVNGVADGEEDEGSVGAPPAKPVVKKTKGAQPASNGRRIPLSDKELRRIARQRLRGGDQSLPFKVAALTSSYREDVKARAPVLAKPLLTRAQLLEAKQPQTSKHKVTAASLKEALWAQITRRCEEGRLLRGAFLLLDEQRQGTLSLPQFTAALERLGIDVGQGGDAARALFQQCSTTSGGGGGGGGGARRVTFHSFARAMDGDDTGRIRCLPLRPCNDHLVYQETARRRQAAREQEVGRSLTVGGVERLVAQRVCQAPGNKRDVFLSLLHSDKAEGPRDKEARLQRQQRQQQQQQGQQKSRVAKARKRSDKGMVGGAKRCRDNTRESAVTISPTSGGGRGPPPQRSAFLNKSQFRAALKRWNITDGGNGGTTSDTNHGEGATAGAAAEGSDSGGGGDSGGTGVIDRVFEDCDLDRDGYVGFYEFRHMVARAEAQAAFFHAAAPPVASSPEPPPAAAAEVAATGAAEEAGPVPRSPQQQQQQAKQRQGQQQPTPTPPPPRTLATTMLKPTPPAAPSPIRCANDAGGSGSGGRRKPRGRRTVGGKPLSSLSALAGASGSAEWREDAANGSILISQTRQVKPFKLARSSRSDDAFGVQQLRCAAQARIKGLNPAGGRETNATIHRLFREFDVDGDHRLSLSDLEQGLASYGVRHPRGRPGLTRLFRRYNQQRSGDLSVDELHYLLCPPPVGSMAAGTHRLVALGKRAAVVELAPGKSASAAAHVLRAEVEGRVSRRHRYYKDAFLSLGARDGYISRQRLAEAVRERHNISIGSNSAVALEALFDSVDVNGDGQLSFAEFTAILTGLANQSSSAAQATEQPGSGSGGGGAKKKKAQPPPWAMALKLPDGRFAPSPVGNRMRDIDRLDESRQYVVAGLPTPPQVYLPTPAALPLPSSASPPPLPPAAIVQAADGGGVGGAGGSPSAAATAADAASVSATKEGSVRGAVPPKPTDAPKPPRRRASPATYVGQMMAVGGGGGGGRRGLSSSKRRGNGGGGSGGGGRLRTGSTANSVAAAAAAARGNAAPITLSALRRRHRTGAQGYSVAHHLRATAVTEWMRKRDSGFDAVRARSSNISQWMGMTQPPPVGLQPRPPPPRTGGRRRAPPPAEAAAAVASAAPLGGGREEEPRSGGEGAFTSPPVRMPFLPKQVTPEPLRVAPNILERNTKASITRPSAAARQGKQAAQRFPAITTVSKT